MPKNYSEDELGRKIDRCTADLAIKVASGAAIGIVASLLIFKRHTFPIHLGVGIGIGAAYANCQHDIRNPYLLRGKKMKLADSIDSATIRGGGEYVVVDQRLQ